MPETCFVLLRYGTPVLVALSRSEVVNYAAVEFGLSIDESDELYACFRVDNVDTTLTIEEVPLRCA